MVDSVSGCRFDNWWNRRRIINSLHKKASYFNKDCTNNIINDK